MWDWVGGRTSANSPPSGLLPAALQGIDIDALLAGAAAWTRSPARPSPPQNPAALLALMWYFATDGRGAKDMVVLPYKDRLLLFSRYLQQLVMESLGKERDLAGQRRPPGHRRLRQQGLDRPARLRAAAARGREQLLRHLHRGPPRPRRAPRFEVEPGVTSGDYLQGFLPRHPRRPQREGPLVGHAHPPGSLAPVVGMLIALYERVVGLYASLIGINAYHQPGVEAGRRPPAACIALKLKLAAALQAAPAQPFTAEALAAAGRRRSRARLQDS